MATISPRLFDGARPLSRAEIAKIIAGVLGAVIDMTEDVETVRQAVAWFLSDDPAAVQLWAGFRNIKAELTKIRAQIAAQAQSRGKPS